MSDIAPAATATPSAPTTSTPGTAAPTSPVPAGGGSSSGNALRDASGASSESKTPAPAPGAETPSEKKARILKAKVFGEEREYNLDEMSDEDLAYRLQMGDASRKHISEAAALKRQFQDFVEAVKKDPFGALKDEAFGIDLDTLAEKRLAEKYKRSTLPEHERQVLEAREQAKQYQAQLEQFKAREQAAKQAQEDARVEAQMKAQFKAALDFSGLPVNDTTMYMLAEEAQIAHDDGIELSHKQLAARVKDKMSGLTKQVFSGLDGEGLVKYLGDDVVKKVLNYAVSRVKKNAPAAPAAPLSKPVDDVEATPKRRTAEEIRERWHWGE